MLGNRGVGQGQRRYPAHTLAAALRAAHRYSPSDGQPPWTEEEDETLREITALGLVSDAWPSALPGRRFGEIAERRLDLGLKSPPLL